MQESVVSNPVVSLFQVRLAGMHRRRLNAEKAGIGVYGDWLFFRNALAQWLFNRSKDVDPLGDSKHGL